MFKFGLALGGGGARGLAHIGVLKVLEKHGVKIHAVTGCSMGSVIGGLYAHYGSAVAVEEKILEIIRETDFEKLGLKAVSEDQKKEKKNYFEEFFDYISVRYRALKALNNQSYFSEETTRKLFSVFPDEKIENLPIKFSAIATDLISGEEINLKSGSLRQALKASSAIPGVFPPVEMGEMLLIDGAASESVPVRKVHEIGADKVLAVDVTRCLKQTNRPSNLIEVLYRAEDITSFHLSQERLKEADVVIRPKVRQLNWTDFDKFREIIKAGEISAEESIEQILALGKGKGLKLFFSKIKEIF